MVGESDKDKKVAKDLILDIQFDHFGTRFATASADQHIRVRQLNNYKKSRSRFTRTNFFGRFLVKFYEPLIKIKKRFRPRINIEFCHFINMDANK